MKDARGREQPLMRHLVDACRRRRRSVKIADSTGVELTGGELLIRSLVLRRLLRRHVLRPDEQHVGILLPPTAAAVATNLAVSLDRRIAINLNYTLTSGILNACIAQAGIRHVLTSRRFLEQVPLEIEAEVVYLEDLRDKPTLLDKAVGVLQGYLVPAPLLLRILGLNRVADDEVLTVAFTSGTTGDPKGSLLTYRNVEFNVQAVDHVIRLRPDDVLLGVLPFFHVFGYVMTLWTALVKDVGAAYHVNPLDARAVGKLCRERRGTILPATPSFLRGYLHRCAKEDFATLAAVITGAEKLPRELADAFEERFGIRPVEGYGTTETAPLISANVPPGREPAGAVRCREGTVGRPVPGVRVKVVDLDTGQELEPGQQGMLWVTGPNVMKGYLGRPEATAEVIRDGWYVTGDVAVVDESGCIELVGRINRFAKIGGEMVPLVKIEEILTELVGADEEGAPRVAVTTVFDPARGERIAVVHTPISQTPDELCRGLAAAGLPNLFIPSPDSFYEVDRLPMTGTGKLDLKRITRIAEEASASRA